ncbi:MAG: SUMF1/EgtB/PvdO family nonheme iron enzyme [candidate division NC10 bacterium]
MTSQSSIQLHDEYFTRLDAFVRGDPAPFRRVIILDFATMETGDANITLEPFSIGKYPVTNVQFARFVREAGYTPADPIAYSHDLFLAHWAGEGSPPAELLLHPVTFVSCEDAQAYAGWAGGRLPTYEELFIAMGTGCDHSGAQMEIALDRHYRNHSVGFRVVRDRAPEATSSLGGGARPSF